MKTTIDINGFLYDQEEHLNHFCDRNCTPKAAILKLLSQVATTAQAANLTYTKLDVSL